MHSFDLLLTYLCGFSFYFINLCILCLYSRRRAFLMDIRRYTRKQTMKKYEVRKIKNDGMKWWNWKRKEPTWRQERKLTCDWSSGCYIIVTEPIRRQDAPLQTNSYIIMTSASCNGTLLTSCMCLNKVVCLNEATGTENQPPRSWGEPGCDWLSHTQSSWIFMLTVGAGVKRRSSSGTSMLFIDLWVDDKQTHHHGNTETNHRYENNERSEIKKYFIKVSFLRWSELHLRWGRRHH